MRTLVDTIRYATPHGSSFIELKRWTDGVNTHFIAEEAGVWFLCSAPTFEEVKTKALALKA